jgi:hypothetical protein
MRKQEQNLLEMKNYLKERGERETERGEREKCTF